MLLRNLRIINLLNGCAMMVIAILVIVLQFVAFNLTTITICLYIACVWHWWWLVVAGGGWCWLVLAGVGWMVDLVSWWWMGELGVRCWVLGSVRPQRLRG